MLLVTLSLFPQADPVIRAELASTSVRALLRLSIELLILGKVCQDSELLLSSINVVPQSLEGCGRSAGVNKPPLCKAVVFTPGETALGSALGPGFLCSFVLCLPWGWGPAAPRRCSSFPTLWFYDLPQAFRGSCWTPLSPEAATGFGGHSSIHRHCAALVSEEVFALHSAVLLRAQAFPDLQTHSYHVPWDESTSNCCWFVCSLSCLCHVSSAQLGAVAAEPQERSSESGGIPEH